MTTRPRLQLGYNPPTGDRQLEVVNPRTFVKDLQGILDVAAQTFSSLWFSDHHMAGDRFRLECFSVLTWVAALDHLHEYVLIHQLASFNAALGRRSDHLSKFVVAARDDFGEMTESVFIEVCRSANVITADVRKILD